MVIRMTSAVAVSIQAVSPLLTVAAASAFEARQGRRQRQAAEHAGDTFRQSHVVGPHVSDVQSAAAPVSPVRMRMADSSGRTKIFPSPIWPVWPLVLMASTTLGAMARIDGDIEPDFRHETHLVFGAAIELGVAALAAVAFDFGDRYPLDPDSGQRLPHLLELVRFDDGNNILHSALPCDCPIAAQHKKRAKSAWPVKLL